MIKLLAWIAAWCIFWFIGGMLVLATDTAAHPAACTYDGNADGVVNGLDVGGFISAFGEGCYDDTATLTWTAPTQNTNGSTYDDGAGFNIYYGTESGVYPNSVNIPDPAIVSHVIDNLTPGDYYFVVTAYATSDNESEYSGEVSKTVSYQ